LLKKGKSKVRLMPEESNQNQQSVSIPNPTTLPELLWLLIATKQGWIGIAGITAILTTAMLIVMQFMRPEKIDISTVVGSISIKKGSTQNAVFLLSPNGGDNTPWVGTGITVKKDNKIKITASGRVHSSLRRLVAASLEPTTISLTHIPWASPEGLPKEKEFPYQEARTLAKVLPSTNDAHYGYGMLLAAIKNDKKQIVEIEPIGENQEFTAKNDGELVLTVNDIQLNETRENIYLLPFKENQEHYNNEAQLLAILRNEDFTTWTEATKREKAKEIYNIRRETWNTIRREQNWNFFYEDNVGAFSVSISVNPK
jgi:hypothetical protein